MSCAERRGDTDATAASTLFARLDSPAPLSLRCHWHIVYALLMLLALSVATDASVAAIDRHAVVTRHNVLIRAATADELDTDHDVLSVGNGAFAANVDITGLQTFNASYAMLGGGSTLADWGWHTTPFTPDDPTLALRSFNMTYYDTPLDGAGRTRRVPYLNDGANSPDVVAWMMGNPHRLNLGQLSLRWRADDTSNVTQALQLGMVVNASQALHLWSGHLESNYSLVVPPESLCTVAEDNTDASFSCGGAGSVITAVNWASYGQPTGSCTAGFHVNHSCDAAGSADVLMRLCGGLPWCSVHVDYLTGFGDPCVGQTKRLAANITCGPAPASLHRRRTAAAAVAAPVDVAVETAAHPELDAVAVRLQCSVRGGGRSGSPCPLALRLAFPYGSSAFGASASDWNAADSAHSTVVLRAGPTGASLLRRLDGDAYRVECAWDSGSLRLTRIASHVFDLLPTKSALRAAGLDVRVACLYAPVVRDARGDFEVVRFPVGTLSGSQWIANKTTATQAVLAGKTPVPGFDELRAAAASFWPAFWRSGAFVDFASSSSDPSAFELERRVVLSQYLMRINNAGAEPPQETGLLCNSWNGKHHNEMRFWHLAHWPLWGRPELLARSDSFFEEQFVNATAYASLQGYAGAHWPKETAAGVNASMFNVPWVGLDHAAWPFGGAPNGTMFVWESPAIANALVIWQQPHSIMLAELQRRAAAAAGGEPAAAIVVQRLLHIVLASADYLASRFYFNASDGGGAGRWWIGPPVLGGHETGDAFRTYNPTFEIVYAAHVLDLANEWRAAAGLPANAAYDAVAGGLADLPTDLASPSAGPPLYSLDRWCVCMYLPGGTNNASCQQSWVPPNGSSCDPVTSHPLTVGVLGMVNGRYHGDRYGVNVRSANATVAAVLSQWSTSWTSAWGWDDALLASAMLRLQWDPRAIVDSALLDPQFPFYKNGHTVCCPTYLPGNGGLLLSIAMLAAGTTESPGNYFPPEWNAVTEGFDVVYP